METTKNKLTQYETFFFNNLKQYIDTPLYFYGSIQRSDYISQQSDIDVDIFVENEKSAIIKLQNLLNLNNDDFKRILYKIDKVNIVVPGYKAKYVDPVNKLTVEFAIFNEKYKNTILYEHRSKFNIPYFLSLILMLFKVLHYDLSILPSKYYRKIKKFLINTCYDNNKSEYVVIDL
jgi:cellulose synthase/poly-beta-1,6-N-acetylglucosamine synthase-like glycosyltransferase